MRAIVCIQFTYIVYAMLTHKQGGGFGMSSILIVDDDPHIRELVRVFLQNEGFAVAEAADGLEASRKRNGWGWRRRDAP